MNTGADNVFAGSIPELYDTYLVPLIFQPYANDVASRVQKLRPFHVLEIAAGTGAATRALVAALPEATSIVATDLNQAMLDLASKTITKRGVPWRQADAMALPFSNALFDVVVCQFGAMFFPEKPKAFSEARRVLKPNGTFIFSVWDRIEENEFAHAIAGVLASAFPHDPPRFMARTPHGYHDQSEIARDLVNAGFTVSPQIETLQARSRAQSPRDVAIAYCQGTPWRNEIEARDATRLGEVTDLAATALAQRFGPGAIDGKIQAHVITICAGR